MSIYFVPLYIINLLVSLGSNICILVFYLDEEYLSLPFYNYYYFYWLVAFFSFIYSLLYFIFFCTYSVNSNPVFPYILRFISIFFSISWINSSVISSLVLDACVKQNNKCDVIIALSVFSYIEVFIWCFLVILSIKWFKQRNTTVTVQEPEPEPVMREVPERRDIIINSPVSVQSQRPDIVDIEMEDIKL